MTRNRVIVSRDSDGKKAQHAEATVPWDQCNLDGLQKDDIVAVDMSEDSDVVRSTHGIALAKVRGV